MNTLVHRRFQPGLRPAPRRGVALVMVLWATALMAVLLGSFALLARTEALETRQLFDGTRARYAAEAGLSRAVYEMRRGDPLSRWVPDGRPYEIEFEDAKVKLEITDESGRIDINSADAPTLHLLLSAVGIEGERADKLADAILDWRDPDDLTQANGAEDKDYAAAGLDYGAADAPFGTVEELQQVLGFDYDLFKKLEPYLTIYTRSGRVNPAFAPALALQTIPGVSAELAQQIVAQRQALNLAAANAPGGLTLPDGTPVVPQGGGVTYTVRSTARLPNGVENTLVATVRAGGLPGQRAFTILRWRYGTSEQ